MGIELARAFIKIFVDSSQVKPGLTQATSSLDSALSRVVGNIQNKLMGTVAALTAGFSTLGMLVKAGEFEKLTISFETMMGSARETRTTLENLTEFAAKTPFEMPEIERAARGLITFGERGEELMETLRILGNAAAGSGTDFGFLALVFNQIRGVGKLLTQDFRQLSSRGILSLQDLADYYKTTAGGAQEMISKGKVSFDDLRNIFKGLSEEGGRFANLMERQSKSLLGLWSTFKDALGITARTIGTEMVPQATTLLESSIQNVEALREWVTENSAFISAIISDGIALAKLSGIIMGLAVAWKGLGAAAAMVAANPAFAVFTLIAAGLTVAYVALRSFEREATEAAIDASNAYAEKADAMYKVQDAEKKDISYLEGLIGKQKLSSAEMEKAQEIIDELSSKYGDLGVSIDESSGKLNAGKSAFRDMKRKMLEEEIRYNKLVAGEQRENALQAEKVYREEESYGWFRADTARLDLANKQYNEATRKRNEAKQAMEKAEKELAAMDTEDVSKKKYGDVGGEQEYSKVKEKTVKDTLQGQKDEYEKYWRQLAMMMEEGAISASEASRLFNQAFEKTDWAKPRLAIRELAESIDKLTMSEAELAKKDLRKTLKDAGFSPEQIEQAMAEYTPKLAEFTTKKLATSNMTEIEKASEELKKLERDFDNAIITDPAVYARARKNITDKFSDPLRTEAEVLHKQLEDLKEQYDTGLITSQGAYDRAVRKAKEAAVPGSVSETEALMERKKTLDAMYKNKDIGKEAYDEGVYAIEKEAAQGLRSRSDEVKDEFKNLKEKRGAGLITEDQYATGLKNMRQSMENPLIGAGRFGFADFGKSIQDAFLQRNDPNRITAEESKKQTGWLETIDKELKALNAKNFGTPLQ